MLEIVFLILVVIVPAVVGIGVIITGNTAGHGDA